MDLNSFSSSTEEELWFLFFFSLYDLRYLVVVVFFNFSSTEELHPPHTWCTFEPSCKNAVVSCSGLHEERSRGPDPSESKDLSRSTCLIFLPASAVEKHLLDVSAVRKPVCFLRIGLKIQICNFYANQENVCLVFLYWWCYFIMMNNKNVNGNIDFLLSFLKKKKVILYNQGIETLLLQLTSPADM